MKKNIFFTLHRLFLFLSIAYIGIAVIWLVIFGPFQTKIFGQKISFTSLNNPIRISISFLILSFIIWVLGTDNGRSTFTGFFKKGWLFLQTGRLNSTKRIYWIDALLNNFGQKKIFRSKAFWGACGVFGLILYLGIWPVISTQIIFPNTDAASRGLRSEIYSSPQPTGSPQKIVISSGGMATLDTPDTSLVAYGVWESDVAGVYQFSLECDDYGSIWLDGNEIVRLKGVNAHNQGGTRICLTKGRHLLVVTLFNGPEKGWFKVKLVPPEGSGNEPFPTTSIFAPKQKNIKFWMNIVSYGWQTGLLIILLSLIVLIVLTIRPSGGWPGHNVHGPWGRGLEITLIALSFLYLGASIVLSDFELWLKESFILYICLIYLVIVWRITDDSILRKTHLFFVFLAISVFLMRRQLVIEHYPVVEGAVWGGIDAPNIYRVLVPYLIFWLTRLLPPIGWTHATLAINFIFILISISAFNGFCRLWMNKPQASTAALILFLLVPYSFLYDYPEDFAELALFILGFWLIRDNRWQLLIPLLSLGAILRETSAFLLVSYFFSHLRKSRILSTSGSTVLLGLAWGLPFIGVRIIQGYRPYRTGIFWTLPLNLWGYEGRTVLLDPKASPLLLYILPFIGAAFLFSFKQTDSFLKRNLLTCLLFFVTAFLQSKPEEIRIFVPLLVILIPLGLLSIEGALTLKGPQ